MVPSTWLPAALVFGLFAAAGWVVAVPRMQALRRARLRRQPLRADWQHIVDARVPLAARLPSALRSRLHGQLQVFLDEKRFVGCQGQVVDDTVRVTIAAQACLLLLGRPEEACFPRLRQVLVYPGPFVVPRRQWLPGGVLAEHPEARAGESWGEGQVVLAWSEVLAGAADPDDGRNVVLHEFAHQIDQDGGPADGRPWRADAAAGRRFADTIAAARAAAMAEPQPALTGGGAAADDAGAAAADPDTVAGGRLFDAYSLGDDAEFFAAATEWFFEQPLRLDARLPALADELARLYGVDPRRW
jgi:Mlc titration factor MtfA (ptsG expression regulator)